MHLLHNPNQWQEFRRLCKNSYEKGKEQIEEIPKYTQHLAHDAKACVVVSKRKGAQDYTYLRAYGLSKQNVSISKSHTPKREQIPNALVDTCQE